MPRLASVLPLALLLLLVGGCKRERADAGKAARAATAPTAAPDVAVFAEPVGVYRGNFARTGVVSLGELTKKVTPLPAALQGKPVVTRDRIYGLTGVRELQAFDKRTGRSLWTYATDHHLSGHALFLATVHGKPSLFVGWAGATGVACLDPATGRERWRARPDERGAKSRPAVLAADLVIAVSQRSVRAFAVGSGAPRWAHTPPPKPPQGFGAPATDGRLLFVPGNQGVSAFDVKSGVRRWHLDKERIYDLIRAAHGLEKNAVPVFAPPHLAVSDGRVFTVLDNGPTLLVLDAATGAVKTSAKVAAGGFAPFAVHDGVLYTGGLAQRAALDDDGDLRWSFKVTSFEEAQQRGLFSAPLLSGDTLYFVRIGAVVAADAATGEVRWRLERPGVADDALTGPVVGAGGFVAARIDAPPLWVQ